MRYRVLGCLEVEDAAHQVVMPNRRKQRVLLALFLFRPNTVLQTSSLLDHLWGDDPPPSAAANLQSYVAGLRRLVGRDRLHTRPGGYLLQVDTGELDAEVFETFATTGAEHLRFGSAEVAVEHLTAALGLWRGPVLDGLPAPDVLRATTARWEDLRMAAVEDLLEAKLELGRHREAAMELQAVAADHPLRERVWSLLMLARYRCGRQDEALAAFRQIRSRLADELGVDPGTQVRQMHQRILAADPALDLVAVDGPRSASPHQLPPDVTGLVDIDDNLHALDTAIGSAITVLTGPGGSGKTALAVRWGNRAAARFPDGRLFADLKASSSTPSASSHVLTRFLLALGVRPRDVPEDVANAATLFRSVVAGRRMLIVLDDVADSEQVRTLLPESARCAVLVTSRAPLAELASTHNTSDVHVTPLTTAGSVALLGRLLDTERVAAEPEAAAELGAVCAGLPLALRIAAANLHVRPDRSIIGYLKALTGLTAPAGHLDVVDLCCDELPGPTARLFALVSLTPGTTFSTLAAAALADITPAAASSALKDLSDRGLVETVGPQLFAMHNPLWRCAKEKAEREIPASERESARTRLFDYYLCSTVNAARRLYKWAAGPPSPNVSRVVATTFDERSEATDWLSTEHSNLLAIIDFAAQDGPLRYAWMLTDALRGFFYAQRFDVQWRDAAQASLIAARTAGDVRAVAAMRHSLGSLAWARGENRRAIEELTASRAAYLEVGPVNGHQTVLFMLGVINLDIGFLDTATDLFEQAIRMLAEQGRSDQSAIERAKLGVAHLQAGRVVEAVGCSEDARQVNRLVRCLDSEATSRCTLGECALLDGNVALALDHFAEALKLWQELDYVDDQAYALVQLAKVHRAAGRPAEGVRYARQAMNAAKQADCAKHEVEALNALGDHSAALRLSRRIEYRRGEIEALLGLAASNAADRTRCVGQAHELASRFGFRLLAEQCRGYLTSVNPALTSAAPRLPR